MAVQNDEVAALQRLGLTEYESRIYLSLIATGPNKASQVSFFGQVPRTKTYGAIRELERKGLLRVIPGKPELYAPSSPSERLAPLITKLDCDVKQSESVVESLALQYESNKYVKRCEVPRELGELFQIDGRRCLSGKLNEILDNAMGTVSYCTTARGLIRAYKVHSEALEAARNRAVKVRFLAQVSQENSLVATELSEILELKSFDEPFNSSFVSVDGRELVVIEDKPDDIGTEVGFDVAVWTTNKMIVELHDQLFERLWNELPSFKAC